MTVGKHPPEKKSEKGDLLKCFHINFLKYIELVMFMILKNQIKKKRCQIILNLHHYITLIGDSRGKNPLFQNMYFHLTRHNLEYN